MIDELSLGLAPIVVESLLAIVERLKAAGQTMIVVEQSLNVALAIADRAVFMEKGRVRFEGSAAELAERDDLARAVFLGHGGRDDAGRPGSARSSSSTASIIGLAIGLLAMGMVLVYRSTRVINFAVGNMGVVGAAPAGAAGDRSTACRSGSALAGRRSWPARRSAPIVELIVVRRLFTVAAGDRAGRHRRHRPARRRASPPPIPTSEPTASAVPGADHRACGRSARCLRITGPQLTIVIVSCRSWRWCWRGSCTARRSVAAIEAAADNPDAGPPVERQPQARLDGGVDDRRLLSTACDDHAVGPGRQRRRASTSSARPRWRGRWSCSCWPACARCRERCCSACDRHRRGAAAVQLPHPARAGRLPLLRDRARVVVFAQSRTSADDGPFAFTPKVRRPPTALRQIWWVRQPATRSPRVAAARRRGRCPVGGHAAEPPAGVRQHRLLRHLCRSRSRCSPAGPASCRWRRWRSPASGALVAADRASSA